VKVTQEARRALSLLGVANLGDAPPGPYGFPCWPIQRLDPSSFFPCHAVSVLAFEEEIAA
jgi:hypothetical protein